VNLASGSKSIVFDGKPSLVINGKDYGNKVSLASGNVYKSSAGMMLLADDFKASFC